jgi:hypothetical protein
MSDTSSAPFTLTKEHLWLGLPVFLVVWKNFQFPLPHGWNNCPRLSVLDCCSAPIISNLSLTPGTSLGVYEVGAQIR